MYKLKKIHSFNELCLSTTRCRILIPNYLPIEAAWYTYVYIGVQFVSKKVHLHLTRMMIKQLFSEKQI